MKELRSSLIIRHAEGGDTRYLERHIKSGGEIDQHIRDYLVKHLRGEIIRGRGNQRTFANENADHKLMWDISSKCRMNNLTKNAAIREYLDENSNANVDTVKSALKRVRRFYPKDHFDFMGD